MSGHLLLRHGRWSLRWSRRAAAIDAACLVAVLLLALAALCWGDIRLAPDELLAALLGDAPGARTFLVQEIRLPRLLAALAVGAALGLAGLLLQTLARNRLAGPDALGLSDGALLAMGLTLLHNPAGLLGPWWHALLGALAAVLLVLAAAGGVGERGYRVLVVGLGMAGLLRAMFELVLATVPATHAGGLYAFSVGSFVGRGYAVAGPALIALALLLLLLPWAARPLRLLALPDDIARGLGLRTGRVRLTVLLLAAALAGLGVAVAGPVGFVAIAAPIVARRLVGPGPLPLAAAGLLGAAFTVAADLLGRSLAAPVEIPAGVISGILGGPFMLWVLLAESR